MAQVVAGSYTGGRSPVPNDNFNGLTVAFTRKDRNGVFDEVDPANDSDARDGSRRLIDLVAPGDEIHVPILRGRWQVASGTSYAAPQVTGAVALLQQYANNRTGAGAARWNSDSRRDEVMRAVLMNSADKLKDNGDGLQLDMEKKVWVPDANGALVNTWLDSDARDSADNPGGKAIPLDLQMGTGALNVGRAVKQFSSGNVSDHSSGVPAVGWSFQPDNLGAWGGPGIDAFPIDTGFSENIGIRARQVGCE